MVRYGAYDKYERRGSKTCLDCPTTITGGKRCPPCSDAHRENQHFVRNKARWARIKAERGDRPAPIRITKADIDALRAGAQHPEGIIKPVLKSAAHRHEKRMIKLMAVGLVLPSVRGHHYITDAGRDAIDASSKGRTLHFDCSNAGSTPAASSKENADG